MDTALRKWAVEQAIATGCAGVVVPQIAQDILAFVEPSPIGTSLGLMEKIQGYGEAILKRVAVLEDLVRKLPGEARGNDDGTLRLWERKAPEHPPGFDFIDPRVAEADQQHEQDVAEAQALMGIGPEPVLRRATAVKAEVVNPGKIVFVAEPAAPHPDEGGPAVPLDVEDLGLFGQDLSTGRLARIDWPEPEPEMLFRDSETRSPVIDVRNAAGERVTDAALVREEHDLPEPIDVALQEAGPLPILESMGVEHEDAEQHAASVGMELRQRDATGELIFADPAAAAMATVPIPRRVVVMPDDPADDVAAIEAMRTVPVVPASYPKWAADQAARASTPRKARGVADPSPVPKRDPPAKSTAHDNLTAAQRRARQLEEIDVGRPQQPARRDPAPPSFAGKRGISQ